MADTSGTCGWSLPLPMLNTPSSFHTEARHLCCLHCPPPPPPPPPRPPSGRTAHIVATQIITHGRAGRRGHHVGRRLLICARASDSGGSDRPFRSSRSGLTITTPSICATIAYLLKKPPNEWWGAVDCPHRPRLRLAGPPGSTVFCTLQTTRWISAMQCERASTTVHQGFARYASNPNRDGVHVLVSEWPGR